MQPYGVQLLSVPASEPVSLAEARAWVRQDLTDDDPLLMSLISAARRYVERVLGQQLVSCAYKQTQDRFPSSYLTTSSWRGYPLGAWQGLQSYLPWPDNATIRLRRGPVQAVTAVQYVDQAGATQTIDSSQYVVDLSRNPARIAAAYGCYWPPTRLQINAVSVSFVAGQGPATTIPLATSTGSQTVTPASMVGIYAGSDLTIDPGLPSQERVLVASVTSTTFTATYGVAHGAGAIVSGIPDTIKTILRLLVAHWYEFREPVVIGMPKEIDLAVSALLGSEWSGEYV